MFQENLANILDDISNAKLYQLLVEANKAQTNEIKKGINDSIQELTQRVDAVDLRATTLENKILGLERKVRRNNVVIFGLTVEEEDVRASVINIFNNTLGINILISDINNIHLNTNETNNKNSHVIVEFVSHLKKQDLFKNIAKLKGSGVTIVNDLCIEDRQIQKNLRKHCKIAKSQNHQARIRRNKLEIDGKLFSLEDLDKLEQEESAEGCQTQEERKESTNNREIKKTFESKGCKTKFSQKERNLRYRNK